MESLIEDFNAGRLPLAELIDKVKQLNLRLFRKPFLLIECDVYGSTNTHAHSSHTNQQQQQHLVTAAVSPAQAAPEAGAVASNVLHNSIFLPNPKLYMPYSLLQLSNRCAEASWCLSRLWKKPAHAKLLHRQPADHITAKQAELIKQSASETAALALCIQQALHLQSQELEEHVQEFLEATFAARPVATLAQMLVWLQQRPELLELPAVAAEENPAPAERASYRMLWKASIKGMLS
jgi:hypothetical protein